MRFRTQRDFTLIGTTDHEFRGEPGAVAAHAPEIIYLCRAANEYFRSRVRPEQVVWAFSGVRSLYDDKLRQAKDLSRDYVLTLDAPRARRRCCRSTAARSPRRAGWRRLRSTRLTPFFQMRPPLDRARAACPAATSPGMASPPSRRARAGLPIPDEAAARRLVRAYGTRLERVLGQPACASDLGPRFGANLSATEVRYLMRHEWAETADDILWRRTKLGLRLSADEQDCACALHRHERRASAPNPNSLSCATSPMANFGFKRGH